MINNEDNAHIDEDEGKWVMHIGNAICLINAYSPSHLFIGSTRSLVMISNWQLAMIHSQLLCWTFWYDN